MATSSHISRRLLASTFRRIEVATPFTPQTTSRAWPTRPSPSFSRPSQQQSRNFSVTQRRTKPAISTEKGSSLGTLWTLKNQRAWQWFKPSTAAAWACTGGALAVSAYFLLPYAVPTAHAEVAVALPYPGAQVDVSPAHKEYKGSSASTSTDITTISNVTTPEETAVRKFRLSEIQEHGKDAAAVWVVRGRRVYDITEWIPNHPGGEVILRAAGGDLEAYWKIFSVHQRQDVYDILDQYFIGEVDDRDMVDGKVVWAAGVDNPFVNDPHRDTRLMQHTARPCNAETPGVELREFVTPNELFYVRNHFWVPESNEAEHTLTIEREDGSEIVYTIAELKARFPQRKITATLQCAGNRRSHMTKAVGKTNGLQWDVGAIGNAVWTGVFLRDVLADAGLPVDNLPSSVRHAHLAATESYAVSIPIEKAVDRRGDVLLAYGMNGEPLPRDHGFPLRVVVPGHVAARSVKWLNRITLSEEESHSQFQRKDYKLFGPNIGAKPDWSTAPSIQETPVQSAVTKITKRTAIDDSEDVGEACLAVEGYAFAGGGRRIARVDVSADGGGTWHQAELLDGDDGEPGPKQSWAWQRWRFTIPQKQCGSGFVVKAVDEGYNSQPAGFACHYNHRGNLATGWHKVELSLGTVGA